jgi:GNAT superfamily N-acetyltransferase
MTALAIEKLARRHPVETFDCGQAALNRFLLRFALPSQHANASQTYVGLADAEIVGFYTLVVSEVAYADAPERLTEGLARHPVPLMLLARLGVGVRWQGRGIGVGLLKDAMRRTVQAAEIVGIRALAAHAKDNAARAFYEHFGFVSSPTDLLHVFLLTKDLQRVVSREGGQ